MFKVGLRAKNIWSSTWFAIPDNILTKDAATFEVAEVAEVLFSSIGITRQRDKGVKYADVDYGANRDRSGVVIAKRNQFSNRMAIIFHLPVHKIGYVNVPTMNFPDMKIIPIPQEWITFMTTKY